MRVGRERQRQFVSGHARAAVETAVDVPDHGDGLSPDREETIMFYYYTFGSVGPGPEEAGGREGTRDSVVGGGKKILQNITRS